MIKRKPKTDEQLYIDWVSADPNWLEDMPLNKDSLEYFKKTSSYAIAKLQDSLIVLWHEFMETPEYKALEKAVETLNKLATPNKKNG